MTTWTKTPQILTNPMMMNQNLCHEPKMNRVQVNHLIIDSKRELFVLKKSKKLTSKPQIAHQSKDLIVVYYVHIVWNVRFEVVSVRKGRRNDILTYGKRGTWGKRVETTVTRV